MSQSAKDQFLKHPYVQQAQQYSGAQLNELDKILSKFPILNQFEAQTKVPKTAGVLSLAGSFVVLIFFNLFGLASPISNLIGWALPAYLSCKALESPGADDDKQWLTYWIIFGLFNFLESVGLRAILYYFPFYFVTKTVFTIWLMLPSTRGAELVYNTVVQRAFRSFAGTVNKRASVTPPGTTTTTSFEHEKSL